MNEIANLCSMVATAINESGIIAPLAAEFKANFKKDVEKFRNETFVYVCPHSVAKEMQSRSTALVTLEVDVAVQYKLASEEQEEAVQDRGSLADQVEGLLFNLDIGPYRFVRSTYYPYHGDSLEQYRTFISIITVTYQGVKTFERRKRALPIRED